MINIKLITGSLLFACIMHTSVKAQEIGDQGNARVGIKGGVNFSNLYTKDVDHTNTLTGFNLGLFVKEPLARMIALQTELYYTTKGSEITYNNAFVNGTSKFNLDYIELPVLLVINLTRHLNIQGGVYGAYLLSGSVTDESNNGNFDFEKNINTDDYNRFDAGLAIGAAIDIGAVGLGVRYEYGFTTIGKQETYQGTTYTFPDSKNSVLNFYIALALN